MSAKPSARKTVSLIVPAYKQQATIVANLKQLLKVLEKIRYDYEIVVVVDGNLDSTAQTITQAKLPKVKCLQYEHNQGKFHAIRLGMQNAQGELIMFIDAGMEIDPNGISMLLEHLEWYQADIIVGSKRHPASKVYYPWRRKIYSYGYYYLIHLLFNLKIKDTQAGLKLMRRGVLTKILPKLKENKFCGDLELLVVAKKYGFNRIYEAPINLTYSADMFSSAIKPAAVWGIFLDTLNIWWRLHFSSTYQNKNTTS